MVDPATDARCLFLEQRVALALKLTKPDKWRKLVASEELNAPLLDFIHDEDATTLTIVDTGKDLAAYALPPPNIKKRVLLFYKPERKPLATPEDCERLSVCDMSPKLLEYMHATLEGVFLPVLSNPRNQKGWSDVMAREVLETFHKTISAVYIAIGQSVGMTMLPKPPPTMLVPDRTSKDKDRVHVLETSVVMWTNQIKAVLKTEPDSVLHQPDDDDGPPGPLKGLEFWEDKAANLERIITQLDSEPLRKVMRVLELTKSPYYTAFSALVKEVSIAHAEATDNVRFLQPLKAYFKQLHELDDYQQLRPLFRPIMHLLLMVWKHSKFYNTPPALAVLVQEICNDLVTQSRKYVDGSAIFEMEPHEAAAKLSDTIKLCSSFKSVYAEYEKLSQTECPANPWKLQTSTLFARLDAFLERCYEMLDLCHTVMHFQRLERVEVGGNKGQELTAQVSSVFSGFSQELERWKGLDYDVLDTAQAQFKADHEAFRECITQLEQVLGGVLSRGFDDCSTVSSAFKLIDSFGDLLERDFVQTDIENKHIALIRQYGDDLKDVQELFTANKAKSGVGKFFERDGPPLYINMPPISGALAWVQGLQRRMEQPLASLQPILNAMSESDEAKDVLRLHAFISESLSRYEAEIFTRWAETVDETLAQKLTLPLLTRDEVTGEIEVNFDQRLVEQLSEIKYFSLQHKDVPSAAEQLYRQATRYRVTRDSLEHARGMYNWMLQNLLDVERPLLKAQLKAINKVLEEGLTTVKWDASDESTRQFVDEAVALITEAHTTLVSLKDNMGAIEKILQGWSDTPLLVRRAAKTYMPDVFLEEHASMLAERYKKMTDDGRKIHTLLLESNKVLKVSKSAPSWRSYVEYVNEAFIRGISSTVVASLKFLLSLVDPAAVAQSEAPPLLEVKLELRTSGDTTEIVFSPPLGQHADDTDPKSIQSLVSQWISDFYGIVKLVKRLDRQEGDFVKELEEDEDVRYYVHRINNLVGANSSECNGLVEPFNVHSHLWLKNIDETLQAWLAETRATATAAEDEAETQPATADDEATSAPDDLPDLHRMDERIAHYKELEASIRDMPHQHVRGWLKVDARPARTALAMWASKWSLAHTSHLQQSIKTRLSDLSDFCKEVNLGLAEPPADHDAEALIAAMTHVRNVRVKQSVYDGLFEPLKNTIALLKKHDITVPDKVLEQLETVPFKWEDTKKVQINAREMLGPLQTLQQQKVKRDVELFKERVKIFGISFKNEAPFAFSVGTDAAYPALTSWHNQLSGLEEESAQLTGEQELFELTVLPFREIVDFRKSLKILKEVWDHVMLVQEIFNGFRATLWTVVDSDTMIDQTKKLQKVIKGLPRQALKWDVFVGLTESISEMAIALPLVQDLRDDAMRERHWLKLMATCGKSFVMDSKLQLDSLLQLELHKFQDGVSEVVEMARAEIKIESQLSKIQATWAGLSLEFSDFKSTGVKILMQPSDTYEALDDNEVVLQNMMGNRFMGFFEAQITDWKGKLGTVRTVLEVLLDVQRSWCSLESIFLGSEDIREQLPDDAKRFDGIDAEFREQMGDAAQFTSPIEICTASGREEVFNKCQASLELCQKSLSDYLEVKKKKFPRFYFISAVDLVDILSKGRYPPTVQEHFSKFTDNTGEIIWELDGDGKETGTATGCKATDKEMLMYHENFVCEGQVEDWLTGLMAHQQAALKAKLQESINAFVENSRDKWICSCAAQLAITSSQVWWTTEVGSAFERLEQGNENAMKEYYAQCVQGINTYAQMVLGDLDKESRTKIKTAITIDVHARDIVNKLIVEKVENPMAFSWQSQLKYVWDEERKDCFIQICDAEFRYSYEYVGNPGRLVITALTDRCYITLTQALRLIMGGAPAGPAGTGKTETTKDLGRGLAIWVIVMNCSDQMNAKVMANFFSGLAQTGAWACFDEFNRIAVEVLSVVAGQFSSILQAIKANKSEFLFEGEEVISCVPTVGAFITMNPGYAGRTELPENLKALFRPCAMVVPDFENIAEINLAGEGFQDSKNLAHKFVELYYMSRELLSKQHHYDWGLRAMTGVLRIAGGMKRADPEKSEAQILMRALRDTNLPKFVAADFDIYKGLITDLFPRVEVAAQTDPQLTAAVKRVIAANERLQPEEIFVTKICNLSEMMDVRHCVFVLGCAGSAKTELWKTLADAQTDLKVGGGSTKFHTINPKSVTTNDLYGYVHPVTKEPYDGIIAKIMRDFSKNTNNAPKWIVLDGDIDAEWIESMNTVMDDNKVLTLVSNERIPLTPSMRMIFEISHLRNASPATVSRAGVIFLNEGDVGWRPYVQTWVEGMGDQKTQTILEQLFEQFVAPTLDHIRREKWRHVTPLMDFAMVQVVCRILEALLTPTNCPPGSEKDVYEAYFQFAAVWAIGGAFGSDKGADFRKSFDAYWRQEFSKSSLKFPDAGTIFDYYIDPHTAKGEPKKLSHWNDIIPEYVHDRTAPYQTLLVPTMDTTRIKYVSSMLLHLKKPVMLVGNTGSAKTVLLQSLLSELDDDHWASYSISFNSFTEAVDLQFMLEQPLEKKTGALFGPPGNKRLVYFIDDINMSTPDKYGTQSPSALLRQQVDYGGFYDLKKLSMKKLENVQYVASMNPTSGSFYIIDRLQRHFATLATPFPETDILRHIYQNIMEGHLSTFSAPMRDALPSIVNAACAVHVSVAETFFPTAIKFHYQWNLRAMASVFQGLVNMVPGAYKDPLTMSRLWLHETMRVYGDRMTDESDVARFTEIVTAKSKEHLGSFKEDELLASPNLFSTFVEDDDAKRYLPIKDWDHLSGILEHKLHEYNESFAIMNLVLFNQAMEHLCRISRIIDNPRGNAMLVGVGGSGKQSLTRLAAFIGGNDLFQIKLTASYSMTDFKEDLRGLYTRVGVKSQPAVFLFTDQQVFTEKCLVYFNDMLAQGVPPDLFSDEDKDALINGVRAEAKSAGVFDSRDLLWHYFVDKVRANLHIVLCMSPVGDQFRNRCRKFPALTNCTSINWFFAWPEEALISVASRFLQDVEMETPELRTNCAQHMAFVHESVGVAGKLYKEQERRDVFTTPKSFLELIELYKLQLGKERGAIDTLRTRLQDGLVKLKDAQGQVAQMQIQLEEETLVVAKAKEETDKLLEQVGKEALVADEQSALAQIEEEKVSKVQEEVSAFQAQCAEELAAAEPAIKKAEAALDGLSKPALTELKSLTSPPAPVLNVTAAVAYMLAPKGTNLKRVDTSWSAAKKMMGSPDQFLAALQSFDKDNFILEHKAEVRKYTGPADAPNPEFNYDFMKSKSTAAAGLCDWIVNICIYHDIYLEVEPKRQKLLQAEATLNDANKKLIAVRAQVKELQDRKEALQKKLEESVAEKNELEEKSRQTAKRANLAQRLVNGLQDEGVRWTENVGALDEKIRLLVGNVMVSSSFIAYIAPFNAQFRTLLIRDKWIPDVTNRAIPIGPGFEPMHLLSNPSSIAAWRTQGLPADPLSSENAAIITSCSRFPLIIDPQLQALAWITTREEPNGLVRCSLSQKNYLERVVRALEEGLPLLLENMGESIDAVLDNMISRAFTKKGSKLQVKLGDRDTDLLVLKDADGAPTSIPAFKLYMQTKLPNPSYIPEIQAQTTLVNFTVTEKGLEDQLLSVVVGKEQPSLLAEQSELVEQQNGFTIKLKELEDNLLYLLATAEGDILSNEELIVSLEVTKATVKEINAKVIAAQETEKRVAEAFEAYRPNGNRGSLIYFLMNQLNVIDHMYQFSLGAFRFIFDKALDKAEPAAEVSERVKNLQDSITYTLFSFVTRGLFERHRIIFSTQLAIKVLQGMVTENGEPELKMSELLMLVQNPRDNTKENPISSWLSDSSWGSVQALSALDVFTSLPADMEGSWKRWKEWTQHEQPETEPLPQEWKRLSGFHQLLIIRAIRPDRMTLAVSAWVSSVLGAKYGVAIGFDLPLSFEDSGPAVPIFFLLSPGVDPAADVRILGNSLGMTADAGKFIGVSLGQGQEPVAEKALDRMHMEGGWVMLENIELVAGWLPKLEKKLEALEEGAHPDFRVFLSAMPQKVVPVPILQKSIKLTNEPPSGLKANILRAYSLFGPDIWESSSKQGEFKAIIFSLCFFHSVVCERRKFGPMGWNRGYPFNQGDLMTCIAVANNYLEGSSKIPWDDLRYLFGEIMYGGHITDAWDRRLCNTFLEAYVKEEILEGTMLFPGFMSPPNLSYKEYNDYVHEHLSREVPVAYGLHPNSEINFMTQQADDLFNAISELQPRSSGGSGEMTMGERVKQLLDEILEKVPDLFLMMELEERIEERTPYVAFFLQECERMNLLIFEMRRSLVELDAGLRGDLSISEPMEQLMHSLYANRVPGSWENLAWPSLASLGRWLVDFTDRQRQLAEWTADMNTPRVTVISWLFNPQAFLTAVMQVSARKNEWALDRVVTTVDVTKRSPDEIESATRDGAYIYGLYCDGARWDANSGSLEDAHMKDLYPKMPVILVKATPSDKAESRDLYQCPVYKTQFRGPTYVFTAGLKTKQPPSKWIMAGVALLMNVVE